MKTEVTEKTLPGWLAKAVDCKNIVFLAANLVPYDQQISLLPQATSSQDGCMFCGCTLGPQLAAQLASNHGIVFPSVSGMDFDVFRSDLYSIEDLLENFDPANPASYRETLDRKIYESYMELDATGEPLKPPSLKPVGPDVLMARRLHDHTVTTHLNRFLANYDPLLAAPNRGVVAIMGGHDVRRDAESYREIALLAAELTRAKFLIVSGGGPGLMEAANLGAHFAYSTEAELDNAINSIKPAPAYNSPGWMSLAWLARIKKPGVSVGIPTWWYGHEPPNVFATHIAKYFENSLREEGLLAIATHGIVYGDGNAGTVQEIFQDGCQNYYRTYKYASPMILLGSDYWDLLPDRKKADGSFIPKSKPAWQLLRTLARLGKFEDLIHLTDDRSIAFKVIDAFRIPNQP
jgi:predicted Rossmann-fold nucleotide-binding protein